MLGLYVAISTAINITSSSPYTYSEYLSKGNIDKLDNVIKSNLLSLEEILKYNVKIIFIFIECLLK